MQYLYLKKIIPKIRRTTMTENSFFPELVILAVKENGTLSEADGYYCTYSFDSRDLLGLRAL